MPGSSLLFVYGTLRPGGETMRGANNRMAQILADGADHIGRASLRGRLHRISWYPGFVESRNPADVVIGDVYRLRDAEALLPQLDKYEEAAPAPSATHEYVRRRKIVTLADGRRAMAWVYVYNRPGKLGERIESGDFVRDARTAGTRRRKSA